jgi:hypothetical protein
MLRPPSAGPCPFRPDERAARYQLTPRPAGTIPEAITIGGLADLAAAADKWLDWILAFAPDRRCWALYLATSDDDPPLTLHDTCTPLTRRRHTAAAQQWATGLLDRLAPQYQRQWTGTPGTTAGTPARVTEWRTITIGDWHGYTPLFTSTPACVLPLHDLDPATGTTCCSGTPPAFPTQARSTPHTPGSR